MKGGFGLRVGAGAAVGLLLGAVGVFLMPPLVVPGGEGLEDEAEPIPASSEATVEPVPAAPSEDTAAGLGPGFDTVRIEPDGSGLVAGRAEPGATVEVLAGQEVAAEAEADADGSFVAFLTLEPSAAPQELTLRDREGRASDQTIILAPIAAPVVETASGEEGSMEPEPEALVALAEATSPAPSDESGSSAWMAPADPTLAQPAPSADPEANPSAEAGPALRGGTAAPDDEQGSEAPSAGAPAVDAPELGSPRTAEAVEQIAPPAIPGIPSTDPAVASVPSSSEAVADESTPTAAAATPAEPSAATVTAQAPRLDEATALGPDVAQDTTELMPPDALGPSGQAPVLVSDADGVRVLQPALPARVDPEVLSSVALDAITYGGEGELVLSGRASGGTVRLYLDNRPMGEAVIGDNGNWSADLSGAAAGVYTLRVDQIDAEGGVVSRIETPFQREERSSLAAAMAEAQEAGQTIAMRTVQPGNTLWAIARDRYGEPLMYVSVFEANRDRIRDPDLIYPGQVFVLPATHGR